MITAEIWYDTGFRPYHNLQHAKHVLQVCKDICGADGISKELEYAAFYHDCVYIPGFSGNEEASAQVLINAHKNKDFCCGAAYLIRGTTISNHLIGCRMIGNLAILLDADLSSLSCNYKTFENNQMKILNENGLDINKDTCDISARFLSQFLTVREFIYHTDYGRTRFEEKARANISKFSTKFML